MNILCKCHSFFHYLHRGPWHHLVFIHDMDATWKELARKRGIVICDALGTRTIVDDIFSWAPTFDDFIKYLTCQLDICMSQNLSLSLKNVCFAQNALSSWATRFVKMATARPSLSTSCSRHGRLSKWPGTSLPFWVS